MIYCAVIYMSASCPAGELVSVSLNEVVRLQCPAASQLARRVWERPNSRLSPDLYLNLEDGSLNFVATPATLGHYLCVATENGYQQTMAIYQVKQKGSPTPQTAASANQPQTHQSTVTHAAARPGMPTSMVNWPKRTETRQRETQPKLAPSNTRVTTGVLGRDFTMWAEESGKKEVQLRNGESLLLSRSPCYLKELVVVSVLLVLCLSVLIMMLLYTIKQRCRSRTAPQASTPTRDSNRGASVEREALRGSQSVRNKRNRQAMHSGQENGVVCSEAPKGSNGHLPNTPF